MTPSPLKGMFVTATDTNVGKTFVAAAIIRLLREQGLNPAPCKPVVSGCTQDLRGNLIWEDVEALWSAAGGTFSREEIAPQRYQAPLAPPFAAAQESKHVDESQILTSARTLSDQSDLLIVEGAGGLLSPVSAHWNNADLARELNLPLLIVARLGLGTLNHTLLTIEAAQARNLPILGIILTEDQRRPHDVSTTDNPKHLADRTSTSILAVLPYTTDPIPEEMRQVDWPAVLML